MNLANPIPEFAQVVKLLLKKLLIKMTGPQRSVGFSMILEDFTKNWICGNLRSLAKTQPGSFDKRAHCNQRVFILIKVLSRIIGGDIISVQYAHQTVAIFLVRRRFS